MMSKETMDRLKIFNKKESLTELAKLMPYEVAKAIVEGDHSKEREEERKLHHFLDTSAREGLHRRRWLPSFSSSPVKAPPTRTAAAAAGGGAAAVSAAA